MERLLGKQRADGLWVPVGIEDGGGLVRLAGDGCHSRCCGGDLCCCFSYFTIASYEEFRRERRDASDAFRGDLFSETVSNVTLGPPNDPAYVSPQQATEHIVIDEHEPPFAPFHSENTVQREIHFSADTNANDYNGCYGWPIGVLAFTPPRYRLSSVCDAGGELTDDHFLFVYDVQVNYTAVHRVSYVADALGVRGSYDIQAAGTGTDSVLQRDAAIIVEYRMAFELLRASPCLVPVGAPGPTWPPPDWSGTQCSRCPVAGPLPPFPSDLGSGLGGLL